MEMPKKLSRMKAVHSLLLEQDVVEALDLMCEMAEVLEMTAHEDYAPYESNEGFEKVKEVLQKFREWK